MTDRTPEVAAEIEELRRKYDALLVLRHRAETEMPGILARLTELGGLHG